MTYQNRLLRERAARQRALELSGRPGTEMDPRTRRAIEAELAAGQRLAPGLEVDTRGRQALRHDASIRTNQRSQFQVNADALRFSTPVEGAQAATKDYVDSQITDSGSGTAVRTQYNFSTFALTLSTSYAIVRTVSSEPELDLDNLLSTGTDGILAATGHYYLATFHCQVVNAFAGQVETNFIMYTPADATYTVPLQHCVRPFTIQRRVASGTGNEGVQDLYFGCLVNLSNYPLVASREVYVAALGGSAVVVRRPYLRLERLHPYDQSDVTASLPAAGPLVEFVASATNVATRTNINFTDLSIGEVDTWAWTFGDGTTSTQQNPQKAYTVAGTYTVSLEAGTSGSTNTETKTSYITVT